MWRQGDILIQTVDEIPDHATARQHLILADSRTTGHRHEVEHARGIRVLAVAATLYLDVDAPRARIVHPEHHPIELPRGKYRIWRQREYTGARQSRPVRD
jgi:hypothetical protein